MKITKEITGWGRIYYYKEDYYEFALYTYNDDKKTMYLSNVKVNPKVRGRGLGNRILRFADKEAKKKNYTILCLNVLKSSWVHSWYSRHGYSDFCDKNNDNIWMKKYIKKPRTQDPR